MPPDRIIPSNEEPYLLSLFPFASCMSALSQQAI